MLVGTARSAVRPSPGPAGTATARKPCRPSLWAALLLLWTALAILPDAVSLCVSMAQSDWTAHAAADILRAGQAVDCRGSTSPPALKACVAAHTDSVTDPTWVFLPVRWADIESPAGVLNWTLWDAIMTTVAAQGWEPILSLHSVPRRLEGKTPRWDRDSPTAVSSFPAEFARFSGHVAEKFGDQVQFYQLGQIANGPVPDSPFGVNPVRYGQMVRAAAPALRAADPDAVLLTAPLVPVTRQVPLSPEAWLHRLTDTGVIADLDIVLWQPGSNDPGAHAPSALHAHPFPRGQPAGLTPWSLASTGNPGVWSILTLFPEEPAAGTADGTFRLGHTGAHRGRWGTYLALWLLPLLVAAGWIRSVPPLTAAWAAQRAHRASGMPDAGWGLIALALLCTVYLASSWFWAVGLIILLSGVALIRPAALWLLTLAVLPLHQVHANFLSPLQAQAFSLAPAHILASALTPALLYRQTPGAVAAASGYPAWLGGGWFLLLFLGGLGVAHTGHFSQWTRIGFFPGWLALLTLDIGLNHRHARSGLISLATGIGLFGLLALIQWVSDQLPTAVTPVRLAGLTFSPNHAAMLLERGFWLLLALTGMAGNRRARMGWLILTALTAVALLLTMSRGALSLGFPGGLLAFWILLRGMPGMRPIGPGTGVAVTVMAVALGIGIFLLRAAWWERLLDLTPVVARWQIWAHTWDMAQAHLWLGLGVDGFYHHAAASFPGSALVSPDISHAHNIWLETFSRWGIAGWIWTAGLVTGLIGRRYTGPADRQSRLLRAGLAGALLAGLAHAQVDAFWYWPDVAAINLVLLLSLVTLTAPTRAQGGPGRFAPRARQNTGGAAAPAGQTGRAVYCPGA